MALTATGAFAQYRRMYDAVVTGANSTYSGSASTISNAALLAVAGPDGSLVTHISATPRATIGTASQLQLFHSKDGGTTLQFFSSVLMATYTMLQTTAAPQTAFTQVDGTALSDTNPIPLTGMSNFLPTSTSTPIQCGTSAGSANAQTLTLISGVVTTLTKYQPYDFEAGLTNTTSMTLVIGAAPATTVVRDTTGAALSAGDITAGFRYRVWYDGSNLRLVITDRIYCASGQAAASGIVFTAQQADF